MIDTVSSNISLRDPAVLWVLTPTEWSQQMVPAIPGHLQMELYQQDHRWIYVEGAPDPSTKNVNASNNSIDAQAPAVLRWVVCSRDTQGMYSTHIRKRVWRKEWVSRKLAHAPDGSADNAYSPAFHVPCFTSVFCIIQTYWHNSILPCSSSFYLVKDVGTNTRVMYREQIF